MRIALGADRGLPAEEDLKSFLAEEGHEVQDHGTDSTEPVDYPAFCAAAARAVAAGAADRAIVLGGSGQESRSPPTRWTASGLPSATISSWPVSLASTTMRTSSRWGRAWSRPRTLARSCACGWRRPSTGVVTRRVEQIALIERGEL